MIINTPEAERGYNDMMEGEEAVQRILRDPNITYKDKLFIFMNTKGLYYKFAEDVPAFPKFTAKYGPINWGSDWGYAKDSTVDLASICKWLVLRDPVHPKSWTLEMKKDFVKECVEQGVHEFEFSDT